MVKIFVGNLPRPTTAEEIRALFEKYGSVSECDLIKNYGFVHMKDREAAKEAIENLHHYKLHGVSINVEASKSVSKSSTKLHVGNVSSTCTSQELQAKFEEYGNVLECDIVKDYAFVHMERSEDAMEAIRGLDGTEFKGYRSDPFLLITAHTELILVSPGCSCRLRNIRYSLKKQQKLMLLTPSVRSLVIRSWKLLLWTNEGTHR
ncbi:RNA-binding protein 4B-like isoform X3 [Carcharodon carcharias]|uniref:RNA-binding protein 4B-like isoform X3 n=1 Tax=Carcharodon carcharias TaxID=13397 RepID=UPI001B7F23D2|nr:RNA-binding protein 4B-like isoform X3 [Carcharodon carcharias]